MTVDRELVFHREQQALTMASVAVIKGMPRDRFEAWANAEGVPGLGAAVVVDYYDYVSNMVEVDFRDVD